MIAYYGAPQSRELGALGIGTPRGAARRLAREARGYRRGDRAELPALELITVIANADPGDDGMYRARQSDAVIRRYLRAARRAKALLLLDIQPGRSDFFTETTRLEKWLKEPDVGLALDPEWRVAEGQVPGQVIGRVDVARGQRHVGLAGAARQGERPAGEAVRHPPVHRRHGRAHRAQAARGARHGAQRRRLRRPRGQDRQVPRLRARGEGVPPRLQAVLRGGHRPHDGRARSCGMRPRPELVVYE